MLRVLSLFAGIGGFDLGLERTGGFKTVAFCEIEPFCQRVLAKHWPGVPCYSDVRELTADRLAADGIAVDVICGGFPCQDISLAGKGAGLAGERSGLWGEYARLIGEIRPRYVIVENVSALLGRGLGSVLGDLASLRYDAEWHCIPASAVGAPHRRDRVWVVAYDPDAVGTRQREPFRAGEALFGARQGKPAGLDSGNADVADADSSRSLQSEGPVCNEWRWAGDCGSGPDVRDAEGAGLAQRQGERERSDARPWLTAIERADWWVVEPDVGRVANGVPSRVDRLKALGNAVVPQIPELIGHAILNAEVRP